MITRSAFILSFGKIYTFYSSKWVLLVAVGLFEVGSALSGAAPNSFSFILGRAIAGLGSAGIFTGAIVSITHIIPLRKRPIYMGLLGVAFCSATVLGPVIGGALTKNVSWRWCFYINLVIGGPAIVILALVLKLPSPKPRVINLGAQINQLDPFGTLTFLPSIVCLLLALQWGGSKYSWSDTHVIVLLVLCGVLFIAFVGIQIWKQDTATVPPRIFKNRSIAAGLFYSIMAGGSLTIMSYYLPIWFQAVKGVDAVRSGIDILPLALGLAVTSIIAGISVSKLGYYTIFVIAASILMSVGGGLLTTLQPNTEHAAWIGFQLVYGLGTGFGVQQPSVAAQTVLADEDVSIGAALMIFGQQLGSSVFVSVAQAALTNGLESGFRGIRGLDPKVVKASGATTFRALIPPQLLSAAVAAYNDAVVRAIIVAVALSGVSILGAFAMEWKSVKVQKVEEDRG